MDGVLLLVLLVILARVNALGSSVRVSLEEFLRCLEQTDEAAVTAESRSISWLLGEARFKYTVLFRGHRLHVASFSPVQLPADVAIIGVRKW